MPGTLLILKDVKHSKDPLQPSRTSWPGNDPAGTTNHIIILDHVSLAGVLDVHGLDATELAARDTHFESLLLLSEGILLLLTSIVSDSM